MFFLHQTTRDSESWYLRTPGSQPFSVFQVTLENHWATNKTRFASPYRNWDLSQKPWEKWSKLRSSSKLPVFHIQKTTKNNQTSPMSFSSSSQQRFRISSSGSGIKAISGRGASSSVSWVMGISYRDIYDLPSGDVKIAIENGPFIVDLSIKNGDFP